jgi:hypothetical protein
MEQDIGSYKTGDAGSSDRKYLVILDAKND